MDAKEPIPLMPEAGDELAMSAEQFSCRPRYAMTELETSAVEPTSYANLVGINVRPTTPLRQCTVDLFTSKQKRPVAASAPRRTTPGRSRALQSVAGNIGKPTTPHAIRAMQQRLATPGHGKQKTGRLQRETPRNALRNLSRSL
ncbi:MAG: hypothetical protein Q9163_004668 [Psora crenata]